MHVRHTLHDPDTEDLPFLTGGVQDCGIKIRTDSGALRHFVSNKRLFASWNEDVPNITYSTAAGVLITSRAVSTLKFLASDVERNTRVVG